MSKSSNRMEVPQAKDAMDRFKMEVASELGVNLKVTTVTSHPERLEVSVARWFVR